MSGRSTTEPSQTVYDPIVDTPLAYRREPDGAHPPLDYEPYKSTALRHPDEPLVYLPHTITEVTGPALGPRLAVAPGDADLTTRHDGEPIGERIIVFGRVYVT